MKDASRAKAAPGAGAAASERATERAADEEGGSDCPRGAGGPLLLLLLLLLLLFSKMAPSKLLPPWSENSPLPPKAAGIASLCPRACGGESVELEKARTESAFV